MSNINQNRLDIVLTEADITAITNGIAAILAKMPSNASLSADERDNISYKQLLRFQ